LILDLLYIYLKKRKRGNLRKGDLGNKKPAIDSTSWYSNNYLPDLILVTPTIKRRMIRMALAVEDIRTSHGSNGTGRSFFANASLVSLAILIIIYIIAAVFCRDGIYSFIIVVIISAQRRWTKIPI